MMSIGVLSRITDRVRGFARDDSGAITVDFVVITGAIVAIAIAVFAVVSAGAEDLTGETAAELVELDPTGEALGFGLSRLDRLLNSDISTLNDNQITNRYERFSDPDRRTDAQVRNAHRNWSRRAADPSYDNPDRANDMVAILSAAMDERGLEPHDNI